MTSAWGAFGAAPAATMAIGSRYVECNGNGPRCNGALLAKHMLKLMASRRCTDEHAVSWRCATVLLSLRRVVTVTADHIPAVSVDKILDASMR